MNQLEQIFDAQEADLQTVGIKKIDLQKEKNSPFVKSIENIIGSNIYNWNPVGIHITLNLPIVSSYNDALFAIKVSPLHMPLSNFMMMTYVHNRVAAWHELRSWAVPVPPDIQHYDESKDIGGGITITEKDDPCLLTILAYHSRAWTGGLRYKLRQVSNMTSQGVLSFSRAYDVQTIKCYGNWFKYRTPLPIESGTTRDRRDNAFSTLDMARESEIILDCPYQSVYPWVDTSSHINDATLYGINGAVNRERVTSDLLHSWIIVDPISALETSAAAHQVTFELQIQADPATFQLGMSAPISRNFTDKSKSFSSEPVPLIFGQGSSTWTDGLNLVTPATELDVNAQTYVSVMRKHRFVTNKGGNLDWKLLKELRGKANIVKAVDQMTMKEIDDNLKSVIIDKKVNPNFIKTWAQLSDIQTNKPDESA